MLFTIILGAEMNILDEVKKALKKHKDLDLKFHGEAKRITFNEIEQLLELGVSITRKNDTLIIKK